MLGFFVAGPRTKHMWSIHVKRRYRLPETDRFRILDGLDLPKLVHHLPQYSQRLRPILPAHELHRRDSSAHSPAWFTFPPTHPAPEPHIYKTLTQC